ncbi:DNA mismatch endonuclease Vsr [Paraburkholderia sp. T12-10]|nr:DNA mismatch endonuclease Vsr [Paraburkholderia sp. T12-10]
MDTLSPESRSALMAKVRGKNTRPELAVRARLHREGFRYRLHSQKLTGRPDIVLTRWETVIFVHGCFWHRHVGCKLTTSPKSHSDFWQAKFRATVERDARVKERLEANGWRVLTIWECETRNQGLLSRALSPLFALRQERLR